LPDPDAFYESLIEMHRDLTEADSALVNAKLVLLLANHIGELDVLREAMALARQDVPGAQAVPASTAADRPNPAPAVVQNKEP
jgi:hypothetical protein